MAHVQRLPAVAGGFYPADPHTSMPRLPASLGGHACGNSWMPQAMSFLTPATSIPAPSPRALTPDSERRGGHPGVLILCPTHRVAIRGMAAAGCPVVHHALGCGGGWTGMPSVKTAGDASCHCGRPPHADEHAIEVQLPFFAKHRSITFQILPVAVGEVDAQSGLPPCLIPMGRP